MKHNQPERRGNFTSSEIVALTEIGKRDMTDEELVARPKKGVGSKTTQVFDNRVNGQSAISYIEECNMERNLGRCLENEINARPLTWGTLVEGRVFDLLGLEYQLVSKETIVHPEFDYWAGSPDAKAEDTVGDIKSPNTLKSFCQLVYPLYNEIHGIDQMTHIRETHKDGEKFYWQLVSNAILTDSKFAELIVYVPYKSELQEIRDMAANMDDEKQYRFMWINSASDEELPWIPDGGYYKNLNIIRFEVPEEDKKFLTERVEICGKLLIKPELV